ncbi:hypothetical protein RUM44_012391 [Polyplax serrata]|uniref:Cell cycle checkpoint control protein n=1 Tax=Polyplax serrata TaxID=468196 RepID=A0ABR1BF07_POLSC
MKCIIPGPNVKVLGRAIHSLAKLGDDLYIESIENELFFRTVNLSKTAYASFSFSSNFFLYFSSEKSGRCGPITCQISMRSTLSIFKSPMTLERTTDSIQIQFHPNSDNIVFIVKYKKGVIKTFKVPVIECEALQAYYAKDASPNSITIQPKIVGEILTNFQNNQDEITWKVTKSSMIIKNYSEPEDDCDGIRTEICVDKSEFDDYKIENDTEVTFCLKELRAVLLFSDGVSLPLTANFSTSSRPIVFVIKSEIFEVNIVVSTLSGEDNTETLDNLSAPETGNSDNTQKLSQNNTFNGDQFDPSPELMPNTSISNGGRLRHVFEKCFEKDEYSVKNLPGYDIVYASDSDSDL